MQLPDLFDHTVIINLPERKDRRRSIEREFERAGWSNYHFFPAKKFNDAAGFKHHSWRGCFYSHLECMEMAHRRGFNNILILEDDVALSPIISGLTPAVANEMQQFDWDMIYFGHELPGIEIANKATADCAGFTLCTQPFHTSHFYAVNSRIIPRLIEHLELNAATVPHDGRYGPMPLDGAYNTFREYNPDVAVYVADPKIGYQRPSRSDIDPHWMDQVSILRPIVNAGREIKYRFHR